MTLKHCNCINSYLSGYIVQLDPNRQRALIAVIRKIVCGRAVKLTRLGTVAFPKAEGQLCIYLYYFLDQ